MTQMVTQMRECMCMTCDAASAHELQWKCTKKMYQKDLFAPKNLEGGKRIVQQQTRAAARFDQHSIEIAFRKRRVRGGGDKAA